MSVFLLILGLFLFVMLVVVHEFGHFLAARRSGVKVQEFGIGFPPRAWHKRLKSGLLLTINWLPLGGFVRLKGEHDADSKPGDYGAASLKNKTKIMLAGVGMNLLAAFVLLTVLAWVGIPRLVDNQFNVKSDTKTLRNQVLVGFVESNSPASHAGLQIRDQLVSIGRQGTSPKAITSAATLPNLTKQLDGQPVALTIKRDDRDKTLDLTLRTASVVEASSKSLNPKGYLGIAPTEYTLLRSTWSAPVMAVGLMAQFTALTFQGLGHAIGALFRGNTSQASAQVTGPVGIYAILKSGSLLGYQFILMIVAVISLTLAIMNVLPIPALDGGRLFVTYLFRVVRRPLRQRTEDRIHGTGFALLMVLFVLITIVDIRRFY